ncbi:MAG: metalloregulator ArsR/SmtB family transcription factor [Pseudomonadota bacterium]
MDAFSAIAEPRRREILAQLRLGPATVNELADRLRISQPMASKHLKALRSAGFVEVRPQGQKRWFNLRRNPFDELDSWLDEYRRYWSQELDALERYLDDED